MTSTVWTAALLSASTTWSDQADELYAARKCLTEIDTNLLGPRVGPVAATFVTRWSSRIQTLRNNAESHSTALAQSAGTWNVTDVGNSDDLQKLLPWSQRDLGPNAGAGPFGAPYNPYLASPQRFPGHEQ